MAAKKPSPAPTAKPAPADPRAPNQSDLRCYATYPGGERCERSAFAKGFCYTHYMRLYRGGDPNAPIRPRRDGKSVDIPKTMISAEAGDDFLGECERSGKKPYTLVKEILEAWHNQRVTLGVYRPSAPPEAGEEFDLPEEA